MKTLKNIRFLSIGLFLLSFACVDMAKASCVMTLNITNGFNVPINIAEIKTASALIYKSKWTGKKKILVGDTWSTTVTLTGHTSCTGSTTISGVSEVTFYQWGVNIFRENGKKHHCSRVQINKSNLFLTKKTNCSVS